MLLVSFLYNLFTYMVNPRQDKVLTNADQPLFMNMWFVYTQFSTEANIPFYSIDFHAYISLFEKATPILKLELFW